MPLTEFYGPRDLAQVITGAWQRIREAKPSIRREELHAAISDDGVARLVELSYHAGFQKYEGRYVRVRLLVNDEGRADEKPPLIMRFASPISLTGTDVLRRLSPVIPFYRHALLVTETAAGVLSCEGVVDIETRESCGYVGDPLRDGWLTYRGLRVRVDAPGKVLVTDDLHLSAYKLQTGRITKVMPIYGQPIVRSWLTRLSRRLEDQCIADALVKGENAAAISRKEVRFELPDCPHPAVVFIWSRALLAVEGLQHGGALVILPDLDSSLMDLFKDQIEATDLRLGERILEFWSACIDTRCATNRGAIDSASRVWNRKRNSMLSSARALGQLTSADGCVVMDSQMNLKAFGGKIQVDSLVLEKSGRKYVDFQTKQPRCEQSFLAQFGTRHKSAFQLCKALEGVMVFAFSQDGDLRLFASDRDYIYIIEDLSPALWPTEQV